MARFHPLMRLPTLMAAAAAMAMGLCSPAAAAPAKQPQPAGGEVVYQIFTRSMRDSNGDGNGDLTGIIQSLDYLQRLGVTSILLTPLYPSHFYHNYFAYDFDGIDPEFGSMADFHRLVAAIHARHMKIYLDEEVQYVTYSHAWFRSALNHPASPYRDFLIWHGPNDTRPEQGPFGITVTDRFPGGRSGITTVNLKSPEVEAYFTRYFLRWAGYGVDGFRLDHMMDDLDDKHILTNLFDSFWKPIFARVRAAHPGERFIAEQADWGDGARYLTPGNVDTVFAFPLAAAIRSFDRDIIATAIEQMLAITPADKHQLVFVENHDMSRIASEDGITPEKLRTAAALDVLLESTPLIYYGQELGMRGKPWPTLKTDAKDIGDREAFRWTADAQSPPDADWYRGDQVYWTDRYNRPHDGVSVAEEQGRPGSLLTRYQHLLALRRAIPALRLGDEHVVAGTAPLLVVERRLDGQTYAIVSNLGSATVAYRPTGDGRDLIGGGGADDGTVSLAPYQTALFRTR